LQHVEPICSFGGVREKRCLSRPDRSADHERAASAVARTSEETLEPSALDGASAYERSRGGGAQRTRKRS
jgi:hypothetical protein